MMKFDLHMHTRRYSPDSDIDPFSLLKQAKAAGLDGIVITEHDRLWPEDELAELQAAAPDLVVLGGVEVSGRDGDVLCYGIVDLTDLRRGMAWSDICREVHRQGGVAVAAHPFRWGQQFDVIWQEQTPELDGLELMSNNMDRRLRRLAAAFWSSAPLLAGLGNSDAHQDGVVGCCYTEFSVPVRSNQELVEAIRARQSKPVERGR